MVIWIIQELLMEDGLMDTIKSIIFLMLAVFCAVWIIYRIAKALLKFLVGIIEIIFCFAAVLAGGWELLQWATMVVVMVNLVRMIRRKAANAALKKAAYLQKQDLYDQLY